MPVELSYCAAETRQFDRDRYLCTLFAPAARREALFALYAFNAEVARIRESVSEPLTGRMRLQWWRDAIAGLYGGAPPGHEVARALARAVADHGLARDHFDRLIDAREADLDDAPPADLDALTAYAEATSSTLVALGLAVLGADGDAADEAGRHVGIAWAFAGLLRAVPYHARQRRLYLPVRLIESAGLAPADVFALKSPPGLAGPVAEVTAAARRHLARARTLRSEVSRAVLPALLPAVLAERYLYRIEKAGYDVFDPSLGTRSPLGVIRLALAAVSGRY